MSALLCVKAAGVRQGCVGMRTRGVDVEGRGEGVRVLGRVRVNAADGCERWLGFLHSPPPSPRSGAFRVLSHCEPSLFIKLSTPCSSSPPVTALSAYGALPPLRLRLYPRMLDECLALHGWIKRCLPTRPPSARPPTSPPLRGSMRLQLPLVEAKLSSSAMAGERRGGEEEAVRDGDLLCARFEGVELRLRAALVSLRAGEISLVDARGFLPPHQTTLLLLHGTPPTPLPLGVELGVSGAGLTTPKLEEDGEEGEATERISSPPLLSYSLDDQRLRLRFCTPLLRIGWHPALFLSLAQLLREHVLLLMPDTTSPPSSPGSRIEWEVEVDASEGELCLLDGDEPCRDRREEGRGGEVLLRLKASKCLLHCKGGGGQSTLVELDAEVTSALCPPSTPPASGQFEMVKPLADGRGRVGVVVSISDGGGVNLLVRCEPLEVELRSEVLMRLALYAGAAANLPSLAGVGGDTPPAARQPALWRCEVRLNS